MKEKKVARAKEAEQEGRTIKSRTNLSGMTEDQKVAHKKEVERLKKQRQRAIKANSLNRNGGFISSEKSLITVSADNVDAYDRGG